MKILSLFSFFGLCLLSGCDFSHKDNGLFGHSKTRQDALKNGSPVYSYIADKNRFNLLDGTIMTTDTAWIEVNFTYHNGKRELDSSYGFHFSIPFTQTNPGSFTFVFSLLDTTNRMFTNGMDSNLTQLCPVRLYDEMRIVLTQKDTDTSKGWTNPIVTDTITYRKIAE